MARRASARLFSRRDFWDVGEIRRRLARRRYDGGVGEVPARRGLQRTPTGERLAPRDGVLLQSGGVIVRKPEHTHAAVLVRAHEVELRAAAHVRHRRANRRVDA